MNRRGGKAAKKRSPAPVPAALFDLGLQAAQEEGRVFTGGG